MYKEEETEDGDEHTGLSPGGGGRFVYVVASVEGVFKEAVGEVAEDVCDGGEHERKGEEAVEGEDDCEGQHAVGSGKFLGLFISLQQVCRSWQEAYLWLPCVFGG